MGKPTEAQVRKYEFEHKVLFTDLVIANNLWLNMPGKYGFDPSKKDTKQYKAWLKLGQDIGAKLYKWRVRQQKIESVPGAVPNKVPADVYTWFFQKNKSKQLGDFALKNLKAGTAGSGLGFIPLLIWGVIALVAAFSATYIIDETTTTSEEKQELLKTTADTLKELNIPPDKAAEIISQTQKEASENKGLFDNLTGGGLGALLPIGIVLFLLMNKGGSKAAA